MYMFFGWRMELVFVLRLLVAGTCGFIVGLERKRRFKEAGIRTHFVVALGACLIVLVSKYGFGTEGDPSRVAAQIVSGIGFLGAGMIFYRRDSLHGLTTAAGVWVTAGIGIAVGTGMYIISVAVTLIVVLAHIFFRLPFRIFHTRHNPSVNIKFVAEVGAVGIIKEVFCTRHFLKTKLVNEGDRITYNSEFSAGIDLSEDVVGEIMTKYPFIISVDF